MHITRNFKSKFSVKTQLSNIEDTYFELKMDRNTYGNYRSTKEQSEIENEERRERYRQILERRKAKSANDQETVQSATSDNTNDISNDAKKDK